MSDEKLKRDLERTKEIARERWELTKNHIDQLFYVTEKMAADIEKMQAEIEEMKKSLYFA